MGIINRESRVWNATGVKPASGDEVYTPGEQPIAGYDNWAMWSATRDIRALDDALEEHGGRHETGAPDEIDLHDLEVNGVARLHGDGDSDELALVDPTDDSSVARIDMVNDVVRAFPRFGTTVTLSTGATVGNDLGRADGGAPIYEYDTGYVQLAYEADWAALAAALEDDQGNTYAPGDFLLPGEAATITAPWEFTETISGDIDGHAESAGHADTAGHASTADSASTADYATESGNSDTVDGYHADDLIDAAKASGEWTTIGTATHSQVGDRFEWQVQSPEVYDLYKLTIYHEMHGRGGHFHLRIGNDGAVDSRWDYVFVGKDLKSDGSAEWDETTSSNFWPGQADAESTSVSEHIITCPSAVNAPERKYPHIGTGFDAQNSFRGSFLHHGALERVYSYIDTFHLWSKTDQSTGKIVLKGMNLG